MGLLHEAVTWGCSLWEIWFPLGLHPLVGHKPSTIPRQRPLLFVFTFVSNLNIYFGKSFCQRIPCKDAEHFQSHLLIVKFSQKMTEFC